MQPYLLHSLNPAEALLHQWVRRFFAGLGSILALCLWERAQSSQQLLGSSTVVQGEGGTGLGFPLLLLMGDRDILNSGMNFGRQPLDLRIAQFGGPLGSGTERVQAAFRACLKDTTPSGLRMVHRVAPASTLTVPRCQLS